MATKITMNNEKNGIEIRFDTRPSEEILSGLKSNGFRWSGKQKMWYAVRSEAREAFANSIGGEVIPSDSKNNIETKENKEYDLWALTRTSGIEDHYTKTHLHDTKEIAAIIRKHLRDRFPFCKWSVTSDIHSISVKLKCSPFAKNSDEAQAIAEYAYRFTDSYNYDNSDSMTDYFDVNFYGVYGVSSILEWDYEQREMTVSEMNMGERFAKSKTAWEEAEAERLERELEERMKQAEADRIEAEKIRAEEERKIASIEADAEIVDADFFLANCLQPNFSKASSLSEYKEDDVKYTRVKCHVSRVVRLSRENYDNFCNLLLADFTFLAKMGGSRTDDPRVNADSDWNNMTSAERETVEWYSCNCVVVKTDDEMIVIDPQGFDYARYVFLTDEESKVEQRAEQNTGNPDEESAQYAALAERIADASADIILSNDSELLQTWETEDFGKYKAKLLEWVEANNFPFNKNVIRAIDKDMENLKTVLYRVLAEYESLQAQFARACLTYDQKITLIRIGDFGGVSTAHGKFRSVTNTTYAQYNDAVKLVLRPERKRQDYYKYLHGGVLLFGGYLDVPEDVLYTVQEQTIGNHKIVTKMSKYHSCDRRQITDILDYFDRLGIRPLVNTYTN